LHASGYQVSMDDFGSGQSSLNMLSEMPVDIVKFDQRFMQQAEYSKDSRIVLDYMIRMVNELGKVSLCEGVETEAHVKFLQKCGCNLAQGFYYSKPIDEESFKKFLVEYS
ncbi:MAG: EAL domain-containing protein, partial [Treponema sp.]|nr:EAL domain-containing protein [Treponema sp.]